jgi:hypothetical protein
MTNLSTKNAKSVDGYRTKANPSGKKAKNPDGGHQKAISSGKTAVFPDEMFLDSRDKPEKDDAAGPRRTAMPPKAYCWRASLKPIL